MKKTAEEASEILATRLAERFLLDGAKNFISDVHIIKPNDGSRWFEVKVSTQPFDAMTPEQLLAEAKEQIAQLEARIAELERLQ